MRIALISDTHFGDPMGTLIQKDSVSGLYGKGSKYEAFLQAVGVNNDYLILLGDIFDFSVSSYAEAYEIAKAFFLQIQQDNIANEMIYVPGNHDADLWHTVEHQVNIINQLNQGAPPRPFRMSVPGIIDDRQSSAHRGFTLAGVTPKGGDGPKYAGLFLDNITKPEGQATLFNFAYPNLYFVTDTETVLITHGQYFELYWAMTGEWALKIASEELEIGAAYDLKEMVGINFPLSQLACSGIGQAGPLTDVVRKVQREVKDGKLDTVKRYLDRLDDGLDELTSFPWYKQYLEWLTDSASNKIKEMILDYIKGMRETRYNKEFMHTKDVQERFLKFYNASLIEIDELNRDYGYGIQVPNSVIYGHTHRPTKWNDPKAPKIGSVQAAGRPIRLYNSGGWLESNNDGVREFCGAEVFIYETGNGFSSISIR